ncbi:hypothetical protein Aduo_011878 [Ancylostoma duodenale]
MRQSANIYSALVDVNTIKGPPDEMWTSSERSRTAELAESSRAIAKKGGMRRRNAGESRKNACTRVHKWMCGEGLKVTCAGRRKFPANAGAAVPHS